jgi:hypothetical protein
MTNIFLQSKNHPISDRVVLLLVLEINGVSDLLDYRHRSEHFGEA